MIKTTVAKDTNDTEFNLFLEACRSYGLDPFRKQIHAVVYSKDNPDKRKMTIIVSRDGLRVLAHRCRDYRPASEPAQVAYDKAAVGPTNPKGIVSATVKLWKQDNRGEWYPVIGEAYWHEFAPVSDEWAFDQEDSDRSFAKSAWQTLGLSQEKLAELAGLHRNFVGLIECGATASKRRLDLLGGGCTGDCGLGVVSGS